jgi:ketosteroid isomerase-like protein
MRRIFLVLVAFFVVSGLGPVRAQVGTEPVAKPATQPDAKAAADDEAAIRAAMAAQAAAWNHGNITAFMEPYENSPETTFIGSTVRKGYGPILDRYKQAYTSREQMGTLSFNGIEVRLLAGSCGKAEFAVVTGHFHLERGAKGAAKKDDGIFSLVWRNGTNGWKIVVDHTS